MKTLINLIFIVIFAVGIGFVVDMQFPHLQLKEKVLTPVNKIIAKESPLPAPKKPKAAPMYKWQDEFGNWHFSQTPPPETDASLVSLKEQNNYDAAAAAPPKESQTSKNKKNAGAATMFSPID